MQMSKVIREKGYWNCLYQKKVIGYCKFKDISYFQFALIITEDSVGKRTQNYELWYPTPYNLSPS